MRKLKNRFNSLGVSSRRAGQVAIGLGVLASIAGCASFGGNVKGNFVSEAPGGICAPTSKIDDQALATMGAGETTGVMPGASPISGAVSGAAPAVHSARALRVVLPARQDRFGRWREPQVVYIEPDTSVALASVSYPAGGGERLSLSDLAAGAPDLGAFEGARGTVSTSGVRAKVEAVLAAAGGSPGGSPNAPVVSAPSTEVVSSAVVQDAPVKAPQFPASDVKGGL